MKDTLEYKILKHLLNNGFEKHTEVSGLSENKSALKHELSILLKEKYIKCNVIDDENIIARIESKGVKYLKEIEQGFVKYEIEILTLKKLKFEQFPAKFWWLILIISSIISFLTTWVNNQISESTNQLEQQKTEKSLPN